MSGEWKKKGNSPWLLSSSDSPDTARAAGRFESGGLVQTRKVFPAHEGLLIKLVQSLERESQDFNEILLKPVRLHLTMHVQGKHLCGGTFTVAVNHNL